MRPKPKSFEEAVRLLRNVPKGVDRRFYALREGFEARDVLERGMGLFVVEVASGNVCEFNGRWTPDGDLLVCENCFEDGT